VFSKRKHSVSAGNLSIDRATATDRNDPLWNFTKRY
jgi:hypothetical protein